MHKANLGDDNKLALPFSSYTLENLQLHKCYLDNFNYCQLNSLFMHCINLRHVELTSVLRPNSKDTQGENFLASLEVLAKSLGG